MATSDSTAVRRAQEDPLLVQGTLIAIALAVVGVLILVPIANVFYEALADGPAAYWHALVSDPDTLASIRLTLIVAPTAVVLNVVFGLAAAWAIARFRFRGRTLFTAMIDLPFAVSPVVAGLAFQRMTEGAPFTAIGAVQPVVGWTYLAVIAGAVLSLCAVIFASLPIALAIAKTAIATRRWRHVGLLAVPPLALAIWVGLTAILLALVEPPASDIARVALFLAWVGVFILAAVASTVAVSAAALEAEVDGAFYRRAARPALLTAAAMLVVVAAVLAWGVALAITAPADFWGDEGILGGSTVLTWLGVMIVMAAATTVAVRAALRARNATTPPTA
jgi:ABC-type sulfate transport system permease subunit